MGFHTPPIIAAIFTIALMIFLFRRDIRERPNVTGAVWLPTLWIVIVCSRPVSWWLGFLGLPISGAESPEEGSPVDGLVFFVLIMLGIVVLSKRQVNFGELVQNNAWLVIFLLYGFVAILWSDFPFVAFKRWIKILGPPTMALVILTEPDFQTALITIFKRSAYVLVLVSILWIKYYHDLAVAYEEWSGTAMNTGIAIDKNALGRDCLILWLVLFSYFLQLWRVRRNRAIRKEFLLIVGLLAGTCWLLSMAHSSTSLSCVLLGTLIIMLVGVNAVKKNVTLYLVIAIVVITIAEQTFGLSGYALSFLNRNPTLTDRTLLWSDLLKLKTNPIFGVGFESFWIVDRLKMHRWLYFNEAHNGYLETYLNLGILGLCILLGCIMAAYRKARIELFRNVQFGRLRLGALAAVVAYNWTEVSFRGPNALWLLFYVIAIELPSFNAVSAEETDFAAGISGREVDLVYADGGLAASDQDKRGQIPNFLA